MTSQVPLLTFRCVTCICLEDWMLHMSETQTDFFPMTVFFSDIITLACGVWFRQTLTCRLTMWKPSSCQRSSCFCSSWENLSTFLSRLCCELPAPGKRWICCKLLWESQTVKLSPLSNTAADPPHVPERGVFLGHWHRIPPLGPGTGIGASGGLWWNWRVRQGRGWGGERMDCPRVLGKQRNMRGYYRPAQRPDGQQMTFCSSKHSAGWGRKRRKRKMSWAGGRGKRRKA